MNNYKKIILDNGIPLYLNIDKSLKQVFVGYYVGYGSSGKWFDFNLDGKDYHVLPGMAHYLEHLLVERSKNGNILTVFSNRNNDANASTSQYDTFFYYYGVSDILKSLKELIEAIDDPVFSKKDVDKTRHAIEEEATMVQDDHYIIVNNIVTNNLYKDFDSYYKTYTNIGNRETTKLIDYDSLVTCYKAFYQDKNKKLVISGNVDEKELVDYLNNLYSKMPKHEAKVILPNYDFDPIKKDYEEIEKKVKTNLYALGFKLKKPDNMTRLDLNYCAEILLQYLFGSISKFSIDLKDKQLMDVLKICLMTWNNDYLELVHSFISRKSDEYYKVLIDKINNKDITKEEYELVKKFLIADQVRSLDYKYDKPENFDDRISYTENFSDIDYYTSVDYDRFKEMMNSIDFNSSSRSAIKKLTR